MLVDGLVGRFREAGSGKFLGVVGVGTVASIVVTVCGCVRYLIGVLPCQDRNRVRKCLLECWNLRSRLEV